MKLFDYIVEYFRNNIVNIKKIMIAVNRSPQCVTS